MSSWASFGYTGIIWGIWLCCFIIPLMGLTQLLFRNRLRIYWLLVCAATTLYIAGVIAFTMLPLTSVEDVVCSNNPVRLIPFQSFATALEVTNGYTLAQTLRSAYFLQILCNILLFVPLGFLARAVFKRRILTAGLIALGTSLTIELGQLTGLWGYYPCAYRIFDIDDLITNTTGGIVGALLAAAWIALRGRSERPLPWARKGTPSL